MKNDSRAFVQNLFKDVSKKRYLDILNAFRRDGRNAPIWSNFKQNGTSKAINSSGGTFPTPLTSIDYKRAQDFVITGDVPSDSQFPIPKEEQDKTAKETILDETVKKKPSPTLFSRFTLRKFVKKEISSTPLCPKSALKPQTLFSISTTDHIAPPPTIDLDSPPSSTPAHSPESSSLSTHTQRSSSTPTITTTTVTTSFNTAMNFTYKTRIMHSLNELKLNESSKD